MKDKVAIFSSKGIGDGMFALQFAHQWILAGCTATVFHPLVFQLAPLFPHVQIEKDPAFNEKTAKALLSEYDQIIFIFENSSRQQSWRECALAHFFGKTWVINPIASHRKDLSFWDHGRFDGRRSFSENISVFCKNSLSFSAVSFSQGLVMEMKPKIVTGSEKVRVAIHPFSSKEEKNWSLKSYLKLAKKLEKQGAEIVWIGTAEEKMGAGLPPFPLFNHLIELAEFLRGIDLFIGNDSGIGHLSSCLGMPTVTICRSMRIIQFWQPSWSKSLLIAPLSWVPNFKPFRWRDRNWKSLISVSRVFRLVKPLLKKSDPDQFGVFDDQSSCSAVEEAHLECCPQR